MIVTLEVPEAEAIELEAGMGNLERVALEALAARGYSVGVLSCEQVRRLMGFDNRWDAEALLKKYEVWPAYGAEDLAGDRRALAALSGAE